MTGDDTAVVVCGSIRTTARIQIMVGAYPAISVALSQFNWYIFLG